MKFSAQHVYRCAYSWTEQQSVILPLEIADSDYGYNKASTFKICFKESSHLCLCNIIDIYGSPDASDSEKK